MFLAAPMLSISLYVLILPGTKAPSTVMPWISHRLAYL